MLVLMPYPAKSHFLTFAPLFNSLSKKGHNITILSHYPGESGSNSIDVNIGNFESFLNVTSSFTNFKSFKNTRLVKYTTPIVVTEITDIACRVFFKSTAVQILLAQNNTFDLILMEDFYLECLWAVVQKYKCPVVRLHTCILSPWTDRRLGDVANPSYVPHINLPHTDRMNFLERFENTLLFIAHNFYFDFIFLSHQEKLMQVDKAMHDNRCYNHSLLLMNIHYSLNFPRPFIPNMVEVGGIHITQAKWLPNVSFYSNRKIKYQKNISYK